MRAYGMWRSRIKEKKELSDFIKMQKVCVKTMHNRWWICIYSTSVSKRYVQSQVSYKYLLNVPRQNVPALNVPSLNILFPNHPLSLNVPSLNILIPNHPLSLNVPSLNQKIGISEACTKAFTQGNSFQRRQHENSGYKTKSKVQFSNF